MVTDEHNFRSAFFRNLCLFQLDPIPFSRELYAVSLSPRLWDIHEGHVLGAHPLQCQLSVLSAALLSVLVY